MKNFHVPESAVISWPFISILSSDPSSVLFTESMSCFIRYKVMLSLPVNGILTRSNPNIRIFDVKLWICQTVRLHRFVQIKSAFHPRIFEHLSNRGYRESEVVMWRDMSQYKHVFTWIRAFQVSIFEIDFLCLNHRPIKAWIHVPLLEIQ